MATTTTRGEDGTLLMALPLVFGVVGFEQVLHTGPGGPPLYQALHWLSDSMMALPFGVAAVWLGSRLATRRGIRQRSYADRFARAAVIALIFAVLLIPGGFLHDQIDTITQAHKAISVHTHGGLVATRNWTDPAVLLAYVAHGFTDGLSGQIVGLPLLLIALGWMARRRSLRTTRNTAAGTLSGERMTYAP